MEGSTGLDVVVVQDDQTSPAGLLVGSADVVQDNQGSPNELVVGSADVDELLGH